LQPRTNALHFTHNREILRLESADQGDSLQALLNEGQGFPGVELELMQLADVLKIDKALKWKKRVLSLLEEKGDVTSLRTMINTSKGLDIEQGFIEALQQRIETLIQSPKIKREAPPEFEDSNPKKRGRKKSSIFFSFIFFYSSFLRVSTCFFFYLLLPMPQLSTASAVFRIVMRVRWSSVMSARSGSICPASTSLQRRLPS
jgi:hypothetical protein